MAAQLRVSSSGAIRARAGLSLVLTAAALLPLFEVTRGLIPLLGSGELAAQSQTTGAIRGTVLTEGDEPLTEATVTVRHVGTGTEKTTLTNENGRFLLLLLQPGGPYELTISFIGYADLRLRGIRLQVGSTEDLTLYMSERAIEVEGIEVTVDRADIFNPSQVGPSTLLNERLVESVPILSRDVMELANLSPLVKTTEDGGFSIGGQNDRYNQVLIDGVSNKDLFGLTSAGVPGGQAGAKMLPIDAVAQYEVLVAPYDVRLSGFAGGVMNAVTKVGTNEWDVRGFAVGRHESLIGDLSLPTGPVEASGVDRTLFGFSAGGPLVRDRAHFFISTEFEERSQPPSGFNVGRDAPSLTQLTDASIAAFSHFFDGEHGVRTGARGPYQLSQGLANVFARVDASLGNRHRLTVRNVFAGAENDEAPNRTPFEAYELESNAVLRSSTHNTITAQLTSQIGRESGNELEITAQWTADATDPVSTFPQLEVEMISPTGDGKAYSRPMRAGSQFFAQKNDLRQASYRLRNTVTIPNSRGSRYTLGLVAALNRIKHTYLPGSLGDYYFASSGDLMENAPQRYQRTLLMPGQDEAIDFSVLEWGAYVQNEIDAGKGLTLHFGLRLDMPFLLDAPERNALFDDQFGASTSFVLIPEGRYDTSKPPSGAFLVSPRFGFNWQSEGERTTQLRGGGGYFTGQLPYVWLSNAFHYNGLRSRTMVCEGRWTDDPLTGNTAPRYHTSQLHEGCLNGEPEWVNPVVIFHEDFQYPRYYKFSVVADRELTDRLSGSVGFLFSHAREQVTVEEDNLDGPSRSLGPLEGYGGFQRPHYGDATDLGFAPNRRFRDFDHVLMVRNRGKDWTYSFTFEGRGQITDNLAFQAGYAYARSFDKQSLIEVDMISNFGFTATGGNPNDPLLRSSNFDRPHKFVAALYGRPVPGLATEIGLFYNGQSGLPFTYVYRGDLNGDGYPAAGPAFDRFNDALYVPEVASEVPASFLTTALLAHALKADLCLSENKGRMLDRNSCRAPWQHSLDLRVTHAIDVAGASVRLEADMINILSLLNPEWGRVQSIRGVVPLLEPVGRAPSFSGPGELYSRWSGGALPAEDEEGNIAAPEPWSVLTPASQWQAQLGFRITFGGRR